MGGTELLAVMDSMDPSALKTGIVIRTTIRLFAKIADGP